MESLQFVLCLKILELCFPFLKLYVSDVIQSKIVPWFTCVWRQSGCAQGQVQVKRRSSPWARASPLRLPPGHCFCDPLSGSPVSYQHPQQLLGIVLENKWHQMSSVFVCDGPSLLSWTNLHLAWAKWWAHSQVSRLQPQTPASNTGFTKRFSRFQTRVCLGLRGSMWKISISCFQSLES